ncbi:flagellar FlbD family protein [bacterium]|nr:flagellar FlbD family protein [FCB group bacterium]MBL7192097.1 flagellar FlbD family protein [bacterium]
MNPRLPIISESITINLTRINGEEIILNADLIETISQSPDTVIQLSNGKKMMVLESPAEVLEKVIAFRRSLMSGPVTGCHPPSRQDET